MTVYIVFFKATYQYSWLPSYLNINNIIIVKYIVDLLLHDSSYMGLYLLLISEFSLKDYLSLKLLR